MKSKIFTTLFLLFYATMAISQQLSQTVRGRILDTDSKSPIYGATIMIVGSNPIIGTVSDSDGNFRMENIPTGRISITLSYMGYETKVIQDVVVNSGK